MAKPKEAPAADVPAAAAPGKKKPVMMMAAIGAVVVLGGAGAWYFLGHKNSGNDATKAKHESAPIFTSMEPFVVNLAGDAQHYLQVGIDLRVSDNSVTDKIKQHLPEVRNGILLLLSSKTVDDLASVDQKNYLRAQIREVVNKPLGVHTPAKPPQVKRKPEEGASGEAQAAVAATSGTSAMPEPEATEKSEKSEAAHTEEIPAGVLDVLLTSFVIQ
ncbi:MAG: flagellar basal body-associated FliL family protein [Betaproteobacteria bacterium]